MKRSLLGGFRALAFALSVFLLLMLGGIKIRAASDVALFVIGLAVFWVVIERLFAMVRQRRPVSRR